MTADPRPAILDERAVAAGALTVIDHDGSRRHFRGGVPGPEATIRLHDERTLRRILLKPDPSIGEAYMDGLLTVEEGSLYDFIDFVALNFGGPSQVDHKIAQVFRRVEQHNPAERARRNVAHHYDLDGRLYDLFLDDDRQYSCAYFPTGTETLEEAQAAKKRHIAAKLHLRPGLRVLDIGSGWGGLAIELAKTADVEVLGVTLSEEQLAVARRRAKDEGLEGRVSFELRDYRDVAGPFDRIVSVGMFEHVGSGHYDEFFGKLRDLLAEDGVALLHSIGRKEPPGRSIPWMTKYIFPGGYTPSVSETMAAVERSGLWLTDLEILRLHYAETLKEWNRRFQARRAEAAALYDERFCRMWEFYLQSCEIGFRRLGWMIFQMQLARSVDAVPLTRDYMVDAERALTR